MKKLLVIILLAPLYFTAQDKIKFELPNCVPIKEDFLWMAETELTNLQYREFLHYKKKEVGEELYNKLLPDTLVWRDKVGYNEPYVEYYLRHPAYNDYPVVGVNKFQAEMFCNWLTQVLNKKLAEDEDHPIKTVLVRLPTEAEWKMAARGGLSRYNEYPWDGHDLRFTEGKHQGTFRCNFMRSRGDYMGIAGHLNDNADITAPGRSYWPNGFGLYNMAGNVAEMVSDRDVAFGGCWRSTGFEVKVTSELQNSIPSSKVGIRYIIETRERKPVKNKVKTKINSKFFKQQFLDIGIDTLMGGKYEVTNELYNLFCKETKHPKPDSTLWNDQFAYSDQLMLLYHWHPKFSQYPVVNIKESDAKAFMSWMENQYASKAGKDGEFRLPTEREWYQAASGGLEMVPYPWGGPYTRNAKGCFLGNHRTVPENMIRRTATGDFETVVPPGVDPMIGADLDGYYYTNPVTGYHPNDFGLYNCSGNVSEMIIQDKGKIRFTPGSDMDRPQTLTDAIFVKGGSWNSDAFYMQLNSREMIPLQSPMVGFRVFMEK